MGKLVEGLFSCDAKTLVVAGVDTGDDGLVGWFQGIRGPPTEIKMMQSITQKNDKTKLNCKKISYVLKMGLAQKF